VTDTAPQLSITHIVEAPRARVYRAFTDPDDFAAWWGPFDNLLPRDDVKVDVRSGGFIEWSEVFPKEPDIWTHGRIDFTAVVDGELLDGVMKITGQLPGEHAPFETRMRIEFHDEPVDRTRLEIHQWLPDTHIDGTRGGWGEALSKLASLLSG
jgi:uncharacterized protein YndB with AHSA1/START domain